MLLLKRSFQILALVSLAVPVSAYADSWSCSHGNDVREVHIVSTSSEAVPCDVVYKKMTEGEEDKVLWSANNDASYCEDKAKGFVEKLGSWGWVCAETVQ